MRLKDRVRTDSLTNVTNENSGRWDPALALSCAHLAEALSGHVDQILFGPPFPGPALGRVSLPIQDGVRLQSALQDRCPHLLHMQ